MFVSVLCLQHGETGIHDACRDGHLPIVHTLYAGGCDLNIPNKVNNTVRADLLFLVVCSGCNIVCSLLILIMHRSGTQPNNCVNRNHSISYLHYVDPNRSTMICFMSETAQCASWSFSNSLIWQLACCFHFACHLCKDLSGTLALIHHLYCLI